MVAAVLARFRARDQRRGSRRGSCPGWWCRSTGRLRRPGDLFVPYRLVDARRCGGRAGGGVLRGVGGVRAAGDDAAVVWDGSAALVPVRVGGRGGVGSGDPGRGAGLLPLAAGRRTSRRGRTGGIRLAALRIGCGGRRGDGERGDRQAVARGPVRGGDGGALRERCCGGSTTSTWRPGPGRWSTRSRWRGTAGPGGRMRITTRWSRSAGSGRPVSAAGASRGCRGASRTRCSTRCSPQLGSHRDRALVAFWVSTGARAAELLGVPLRRRRPGPAADHGDPQGDPGVAAVAGRRRTRSCGCGSIRRSCDGLVPAGRDEPLWWTLRRPFRALSYHAARAMFARANAALGANWSLHDLRHTAAYRMARDPQMPLTDVQWVLGHAHLSTTQLYLNAGARGRDRRGARLPRRAAPRPRPGRAAGAGIPAPRACGSCSARTSRDRRRADDQRDRPTPRGRPRSPTPTSAAGDGQTRAQLLAAFPPRAGRVVVAGDRGEPARRCWPGCWPRRSRWTTRPASRPRRLGVLAVLDWLATHPGDTWQQRWLASGAEDQPDWRDAITAAGRRARPGEHGAGRRSCAHLGPGLLVLICADVIRPEPGLAAALRRGPAEPGRRDGPHPRPARRSPSWPRCAAAARSGWTMRAAALTPRSRPSWRPRAARSPTITVGDCLELLQIAAGIARPVAAHEHSPLFYQLLHAWRVRPQDAPATIRVFSGRGQLSCEQLIDRYGIACRPVRDVLVDYLRERQPTLDHATLQQPGLPASAGCSGGTWNATTPASTRCTCPARSPRPGSSGC